MIKNVYTPNDYKDMPTDSKMIQAAVDEAAKYGASVVIPRLNERTGELIWRLDETIKLYTGSDVLLDNCHIRLEDGTYIRFFENSSADDDCEWWMSHTRQKNIKLVARGNTLLDGGNHNGLFEHCFNIYDENGKFLKKIDYLGFKAAAVNVGVRFRNVEGLEVSGLKFVNQRYWAMCFEYCSSLHVHDIVFDAESNVPNQDGIDIRVGCHNVLIENVSGKSGDDMVALTNFGAKGVKLGESDMDSDIHDVIVRGIRSFETSRCDMLRILNRGGYKIYNVSISDVIDLTPVGCEKRPLAGIRIGDLNDYPARLNEPGETRNITVHNVITRARFGVYVANSLVDSCFENVMMVGDGGIGMYFNGCITKNVFVNKLMYSSDATPPASDIGYKHVHHRVNIDHLSAVIFNNSTAENVCFDNVVAAEGLDYAFSSNTDIALSASKVYRRGDTALHSPLVKLI